MQTIGPYRLVEALGTCPVGGVWSAVDQANNPVTAAVLTTTAAHDPGWRRAFAATANALAQSGQVPVIAGDYSGAIPWVASAARDGSVLAQVFVALGMEYQPTPEAGAVAQAPSEREAEPGPASGAPASGGPLASSPPWERPSGGSPSQGAAPVRSPHTVSPFSVPPAAPPPRRRTGALVGVMVLVVALLVGGGAIIAVAMWPEDDGEPVGQESTPPAVQEPTLSPPSQPGEEPPLEGEWPVDWPVFEPDETTTELAGLIGELPAQTFRVPEGWDCPSVQAQGTFAHYTCGPDGDATDIGGDLIVRLCPDPCDVERRDQLRAEVDAWGLRWVHASGPQYWAETNEIEGEERYGLVVTAYYRTRPEGRIDRQLILRLTAPVDQIDDVRKVANEVHESVT